MKTRCFFNSIVSHKMKMMIKIFKIILISHLQRNHLDKHIPGMNSHKRARDFKRKMEDNKPI